jgi:hypothetical protein
VGLWIRGKEWTMILSTELLRLGNIGLVFLYELRVMGYELYMYTLSILPNKPPL